MNNNKQLIWRFLSFFSILAAPISGYGDVNIAGLHVMLSPDLELERQEIVISPDSIKTTYLITNTSTQDIMQTMLTAQSGNLVVNDQPIECKVHQIAISISGHDVSRLLKSYGLPFEPIQALHSIDASPNRDTIRKKLIDLELLNKDDEAPKWMSKSYCSWNQTFLSGQETTIKHSFKPIVIHKNLKAKNSGGIFSAPVNIAKAMYNLTVHWSLEEQVSASTLQAQLEKYNPELKEFCPKVKDFQELANTDNKAAPNRKLIEAKELNYDFMIDNLCSTPSKQFVLKINTPADMHPLLCWNGELKSASKNSLIFDTEHYLPIDPIHILYVEK